MSSSKIYVPTGLLLSDELNVVGNNSVMDTSEQVCRYGVHMQVKQEPTSQAMLSELQLEFLREYQRFKAEDGVNTNTTVEECLAPEELNIEEEPVATTSCCIKWEDSLTNTVYSCDLWDDKSQDSSEIVQSATEHASWEKFLECQECEYKTVCESSLQRHVKTHQVCKPFTCVLCNYAGAKAYHLRNHMKTHSSQKPFRCQECPFKTKQKHSLQQHVKRHTEEKPFSRSKCTYKTANSGWLDHHMVSHTEEQPFQCKQCSFKTKQKSFLHNRVKIHTGEKCFQCQQCEYKTATKASWRKHNRTHTGEKPFQCQVCPHKTADKSNLKKHMRTHTG